jgi:hypothetical protein
MTKESQGDWESQGSQASRKESQRK